ncbi:hypothetical protein EW146_g2514 [Bondarzewia mesenterica]|uniref:Uncharacterized protein n=1 Tax=Bondarzewia mesenterica TaxID=1095465 RepID=A0A4S4M2A6_9AGAM|nr:hypothetical protein EW146_g2514 [Bondarzewia mesenterica]
MFNVHTPSSSFAIVHSVDEPLLALFDKLSRKANTDYHGQRVGSGWLKYEWSGSVWNLDDGMLLYADYTIFVWRLNNSPSEFDDTPTIYLRNPSEPLPSESSYRNLSYYLFRPDRRPGSSRAGSRDSHHDGSSIRSKGSAAKVEHEEVPKFKKEFEKFHNENGVRTIMGSIGPVQNGNPDVAEEWLPLRLYLTKVCHEAWLYSSGCGTSIGKWPITVGHTKTIHSVYLSEESHFDVVLGRSFMERRMIKTNPVDATDIVCLDTGEKLDCELVILKDGKGEIVTVT